MSSETEWRRIVGRLIECLNRETQSLAACDDGMREWHGEGETKVRLLVEVCRLPRRDQPPEACDLLKTLSASLQSNERLLRIHLEAMREVTHIMQAASAAAQSDGTYSARRPPRTL